MAEDTLWYTAVILEAYHIYVIAYGTCLRSTPMLGRQRPKVVQSPPEPGPCLDLKPVVPGVKDIRAPLV